MSRIVAYTANNTYTNDSTSGGPYDQIIFQGIGTGGDGGSPGPHGLTGAGGAGGGAFAQTSLAPAVNDAFAITAAAGVAGDGPNASVAPNATPHSFVLVAEGGKQGIDVGGGNGGLGSNSLGDLVRNGGNGYYNSGLGNNGGGGGGAAGPASDGTNSSSQTGGSAGTGTLNDGSSPGSGGNGGALAGNGANGANYGGGAGGGGLGGSTVGGVGGGGIIVVFAFNFPHPAPIPFGIANYFYNRFTDGSYESGFGSELRRNAALIPSSPPPPSPDQSFLGHPAKTLNDPTYWWEELRRRQIVQESMPPSNLKTILQQRFIEPLLNQYDFLLIRRLFPIAAAVQISILTSQIGDSRVQNNIEGWNVYVGMGVNPNLTLAPTSFATSLPIIVAITPPGSGTQSVNVAVRKQDTYGLESQNQSVTQFIIDSSGATVVPNFGNPQGLTLVQSATDAIRVFSSYPNSLTDTAPATNWKIWIGTTMPNPAVDMPTLITSATRILAATINGLSPNTYFVIVGLYRTSDATLSPTLSGSVVVATLPSVVEAVPSTFDQ